MLNWRYHMILRGIQRERGQPTRQKLPITPHILRSIKTQLNLNLSADLTFWAACLVAFFSFFRKSNLLPPSAAGFDKNLSLKTERCYSLQLGSCPGCSLVEDNSVSSKTSINSSAKTTQFRSMSVVSLAPSLPASLIRRSRGPSVYVR